MPVARDRVKACLLDVYDTILASHFPGRLAALAGLADVPAERLSAEWLSLARDRDTGKLPMAAAFARALAACGRDPDPGLVERLVQADAEAASRRIPRSARTPSPSSRPSGAKASG